MAIPIDEFEKLEASAIAETERLARGNCSAEHLIPYWLMRINGTLSMISDDLHEINLSIDSLDIKTPE